MADYNRYYATKELFGEPYPELLNFFKKQELKGKLLDVGCGQGRNSIALARLGYEVTGIDLSKVGVEQMIRKSATEHLTLTGLVADMYLFEGYQNFDWILLDSIFHFNRKDKHREIDLIHLIANRLKPKGLICFCIADIGAKVKTLKDSIQKTGMDIVVRNDSTLTYHFVDKASNHTSTTNYWMWVIEKI